TLPAKVTPTPAVRKRDKVIGSLPLTPAEVRKQEKSDAGQPCDAAAPASRRPSAPPSILPPTGSNPYLKLRGLSPACQSPRPKPSGSRKSALQPPGASSTGVTIVTPFSASAATMSSIPP